MALAAARLLKTRWGVSKVILFGSLLTLKKVHSRTDIDLAVWGLTKADYFRALAEWLDIDPDFSIDLIEAEDARLTLQQAIQRGIEL